MVTKIISRVFNLILDIAKYAMTKIKYRFPKVLSIEETLDVILSEKKSFVRYGDGEFNQLSQIAILFLHQHLYFPSKLAQIYNIQTRLATKVNRKLPQKLVVKHHNS
jgi:hypothetical protein